MGTKSFLLVFITAATATASMALFRSVLFGNYAWKGSLSQFLQDTLALFGKPLFLVAGFSFAVSVLLWMAVLATQKLSIAYPMQIGLVLIMTGLVSSLLFAESISLRGYLGYTFLITGVFLVSR